MGRYLIVANETIGGEMLMVEIRRRIAPGPSSFYVLVPLAPMRLDGFGTPPDFFSRVRADVDAQRRREDAARHRSRLTSESRLNQLINHIRAEGGEATGGIGEPDPVEAVAAVLGREPAFDEIIISTLPQGVSRWLRMDVPHRVQRQHKIPVTTVTARA